MSPGVQAPARPRFRPLESLVPKSRKLQGECPGDALGLLLGPDLWVSSPLVGSPFAVPFAAYTEGPTPGVVEGNLIDGELYSAKLPKGMAPNAMEVCTEDPRDMIGEHVLFLFTRGMNLAWRIGKIETVLSDAERAQLRSPRRREDGREHRFAPVHDRSVRRRLHC